MSSRVCRLLDEGSSLEYIPSMEMILCYVQFNDGSAPLYPAFTSVD